MVTIALAASALRPASSRSARLAVDVHGAGAALGDAAAVLRAGQAELLAEHPQQRRVGLHLTITRLAVDVQLRHGDLPLVTAILRRYMLRRYWPPTSKSACVIWPSEHTRTASISAANTLPSCDHRLLQALRASPAPAAALRFWKVASRVQLALLLSSVERMSSSFCGVASPFGLRNVLTPMIGSVPSCFSSRSRATLPGSCRAGSRSPSRRARRRARQIASNSLSTASSTRSVSSSMMNEPWFGFSFFARPHSG